MEALQAQIHRITEKKEKVAQLKDQLNQVEADLDQQIEFLEQQLSDKMCLVTITDLPPSPKSVSLKKKKTSIASVLDEVKQVIPPQGV